MLSCWNARSRQTNLSHPIYRPYYPFSSMQYVDHLAVQVLLMVSTDTYVMIIIFGVLIKTNIRYHQWSGNSNNQDYQQKYKKCSGQQYYCTAWEQTVNSTCYSQQCMPCLLKVKGVIYKIIMKWNINYFQYKSTIGQWEYWGLWQWCTRLSVSGYDHLLLSTCRTITK